MVTAHGYPAFIDDANWLYDRLGHLTDAHEASQALPWKIDDAPRDFTEMLMSAIIGVEIPTQRIDGKWKTNQNRPEADKIGVVAGLLGKGDDDSLAMVSLIRQHIQG